VEFSIYNFQFSTVFFLGYVLIYFFTRLKNVDNFKAQKTIFLREIPKFAVLDEKE